jgi:hypothetical protein
MQLRFTTIALVVAFIAIAATACAQSPASNPAAHKDHTLGYDDTPFLPGGKWRVHDISRPRPEIITPGTESSQEKPGRPPSDAIVLFDGSDLSHWTAMIGGEASEPKWKLQDGYMEVVDKTGSLMTKEKFGNIQLHVEWSAPIEVKGQSQERGNSGILLMSRYEVQVLDSFDNATYADGQAAAIYGQYPPLVNASRKPGEWQTYDIFFESPRFDGEKLSEPAYVTVVHNGVLVQNHVQIIGDTPHARLGTYKPHPAEMPLTLQNHHAPVRYRNIWVRRLPSTP